MAYCETNESPMSRPVNHRGPAFQDYERKLLFRIINNYRSIVDNKDTSLFVSGEKQKVWETIVSVFNSSPEIKIDRSVGQVRDFYENAFYYYRKKGFIPGGLTVEDIFPNQEDISYEIDGSECGDTIVPVILSDFQRSQLTHLAEERRAVVDNKSTVELALKAKRLAWTEITNVFNSVMRDHEMDTKTRTELERAYDALKPEAVPGKVPWTFESPISKVPEKLEQGNSVKAQGGKTDKILFQENEKSLLFAIVASYDDHTGTKQNRPWEVITEKFNEHGLSVVPRTKRQLQRLFANRLRIGKAKILDKKGGGHVRKDSRVKKCHSLPISHRAENVRLSVEKKKPRPIKVIAKKINEQGVSTIPRTKVQLRNLLPATLKGGGSGPTNEKVCKPKKAVFLDAEKRLIIAMVESYVDYSGKKHKRPWKAIQEEFNSKGVSPVPRTPKQLRDLFYCMVVKRQTEIPAETDESCDENIVGASIDQSNDTSLSVPFKKESSMVSGVMGHWDSEFELESEGDGLDCTMGKALFLTKEKRLLLCMVKAYDEYSGNRLNRSWQVLTKKFNEVGISPVRRTRYQLANLFYNISLGGGFEQSVENNGGVYKVECDELILDDSENEKLLELVEERQHIFKDDSGSETAIEAKETAWTDITTAFNSATAHSSGVIRTCSGLQWAYCAYVGTLVGQSEALWSAGKRRKAGMDVITEQPAKKKQKMAVENIDQDDSSTTVATLGLKPVIEDLGTICEVSIPDFDDDNPYSPYTAADCGTDRTQFQFLMVERRMIIALAESRVDYAGKKHRQWDAIAQEFNRKGLSPVPRTKRQLRDLFYSMVVKRHMKIPGHPGDGSEDETERENCTVGGASFLPIEKRLLMCMVKAYDLHSGSRLNRSWQVLTKKFNEAGISPVRRTRFQLANMFYNIGLGIGFGKNKGGGFKLESKASSHKRVLDDSENQTLLQLVTERQHIFQGDNDSEIEAKQTAWAEIASAFNSATANSLGVVLTVSDLQLAYCEYVGALAGRSQTRRDDDELCNETENLTGEKLAKRRRRRAKEDIDNSLTQPGGEFPEDVEMTFKCPSDVFNRWVVQKQSGGFEDDASFLDYLLRLNEPLSTHLGNVETNYNAASAQSQYGEAFGWADCYRNEGSLPLTDDSNFASDSLHRKRIKLEPSTASPAPYECVVQLERSPDDDSDPRRIVFENGVIKGVCGSDNRAISQGGDTDNMVVDDVASNYVIASVDCTDHVISSRVWNKANMAIGDIPKGEEKGKPAMLKKRTDEKKKVEQKGTVTDKSASNGTVCYICGASFQSKSCLTSHMVLHGIGSKLYQCNYCGKYLKDGTQLKYHMQMHDKVKLFMCQHCSKSYTSNSMLKNHIRKAHTRENLHYCSQCPKGFATVKECHNHEIRHNGGIYKCNLCEWGFTTEAVLLRHKFRKHGHGSLYECECGSSFVYRPHYEKHLTTHHPELTEEQRGLKLDQPVMGSPGDKGKPSGKRN